MPDTPSSYAPYAGVALFPRAHTDLTSTAQCPACFHALTSVVCTYCGLDLNHSVAAELAVVSEEVAARLDTRTELIGRIRFDTARERKRVAELTRQTEDARQTESARPIGSVAAPVSTSVTAPAPAWAAPQVAPRVAPASTAPQAPSNERRRPTVQIALLVVGISLLSIAAVFFLVYAFITYGIVWRSVIIGSITVAAFATATLLRRRALTGTAEGIGAFAVVLLYLDAFAVRANDLFNTASSDGLVYWGATLVVSAFLMVGWHRISRLRVGNVAAFAVFAPGVGLLTAGLAGQLDGTTRVFAAFLAVGLAGLVHPLASKRTMDATTAPTTTPERITALAFAGIGLCFAFVTAFLVDPGNDAGASTALALVALAAAAHVVVALRAPGEPTLSRAVAAAFASVGAIAISLALGILVYRTLEAEAAVAVALVVTTVVALALVYLAHRPLSGAATLVARASAISAMVVAGLALTVPVAIALYTLVPVPVVATGEWFWQLDPTDVIVNVEPLGVGAVLGLASTVAIVAGFLAATRLYPRLRVSLVWSGAAVLLLAVPLLSVLWAVLAGWFVFAALAVASAWRPRIAGLSFARLPFTRRLPVLVLGAVATALGFCTAWASIATWAIGLVVTILLVLAARSITTPNPVAVRAVLLALAAVLGLMGASAAGRQLMPVGDDVFTQVRLVSMLAVALVALAAVPAARLFSTPDRHTLFAIGAPVALVTVPLAGLVSTDDGTTALAAPIVTLALGIALLAALGAWILPKSQLSFRPERGIAIVAVAPALAFTLFAAVDLSGATDSIGLGATNLVLPTAALLVAAGALALVARQGAVQRGAAQHGTAQRGASDLGVALVAVPGLFWPVLVGADLAWLVLLVSAVTTLLLAVSADGLFASASPRKQLGWLALALATASLWWSLASASVTAVEAYVLPLAGALLFIALLVWRAETRAETRTEGPAESAGASPVAPLLTFAALLIGLVPVAISAVAEGASESAFAEAASSAGAPWLRALVVAAVAAALLLGGSLVRVSAAMRPYLDASAAAGFLALLVVAGGRVLSGFATGSHYNASIDLWVVVAVIVLFAAGFGQSSPRAGDRAATSPTGPPALGRALVLVGIVLGTIVETVLLGANSFGDGDLAVVRAIVSVLVLSALYLVSTVVDRTPLDRVVGWVAIGAAAIVAIAAMTTGAVDTVETVTAPIAIALVWVGGIALARDPALRSWAALGVPLAVVFLPSLFATTVDRPIWRLVAIGIVAVAAIIVGSVRRLQAPFVVGIIVALVHGVATFAPQLRSVYQVTEWWVWLGIGGVAVTVLSLRYERSLRTAKNVVVGIGGLR